MKGVSEYEITTIEHQYGTLPQAYKQILKLIGHKAGGLINQREFYFYLEEMLKINQDEAEIREELIEEGEDMSEYPPHIFFITERIQSAESRFILTNSDPEDSPVY